MLLSGLRADTFPELDFFFFFFCYKVLLTCLL